MEYGYARVSSKEQTEQRQRIRMEMLLQSILQAMFQ